MPDVSRGRAATQPNGRDRDDTMDEHDDAPGGSLPNGIGSSRKRGRAELNNLDEGEDADDDDAEAELNAARMAKRKKQRDLAIERTMQERDTDGYLPGSIVRVKLLRFVTYDSVEFRPGPYLNMIIGPNGTGKSTIVCAIALGLGWKPNVLGRAKDVAAFVKQGHETGSIEVELKGKPGQRNLKIRREISRQDNQSDWYIDGQKTTQKEVHAKVKALDIKIDNLCSFLPQDKVADFARMAPPQLLKEVQKAAGEGDLLEKHERLTELGRKEVKVSEKLASEHAEVEHLKQRQDVLEKDVQRFRERQAIEQQVKFLSARIPQLKYTKARARSRRLKTKVESRRDRVARAENYLKPFKEVKEDYDDISEKLRLRKQKTKSSLDAIAKDLQKDASALEKAERESEGLHHEMQSLEQREQNHRTRVEALKAEIRELQASIANPPEAPDTQATDAEVRKIRIKMRAVTSEASDVAAQMEDYKLENRSVLATLDDSRRKLESLDNVRQQRLRALTESDQHSAKAVMWLRDNQQLFSGKVYEPVVLEASIRDMRYAGAVESCLPWSTIRTFVCELRSDYDIFTRELIDRQKLRLNVFEVEGFEDNLVQGVYPPEVLQAFNFETTAIDVIEAPDAVKKFLSYTSNLNRIPLSLNANPPTEMLDTITAQRRILRYVYGTTNYNVSISNYGDRRATVVTKNFNPRSRNFGTAVDQNRKQELERSILESSTTMRANEEQVKALQQREQTLKADMKRLSDQLTALTKDTADAREARRQYEKDKSKLDTKKRHLNDALKKPSTEVERVQIRRKLQKLAEKRAGLAQDIQAHMLQQNKLRLDFDYHFLESLQHEANKISLAEQLKQAEDMLKDAKAVLERTLKEEDKTRKYARSLLTEFDEKTEGFSEELQAMLREDPADGVTIDALEQELVQQKTNLDYAHGISDDVFRVYEQRKEEIQKHTGIIERYTEDKRALDEDIKEIRDEWEPAIRSLVEEVSKKFSAAFDRVGCAGEIRVATDRDYDKWGIEILVKFRDNEELQLLTGQRQSGGERSLSTIMFLMGLTELGKSPFSLVDEINQGMDQRAERAVHNQMVDVTCGQHARQYFLITPKLLNNLRYHERMRVLVICNGEWLPPKFNFKTLLKNHRDREANASRSK